MPDYDCAQAIVNGLNAVNIDNEHIAVLAKHEKPLEELPAATQSEKSDWIPALQRGIGVGGSLGLFAGLAALAFQPAGLVIGGSAILISSATGASFGAWVSAMIGSSAPNSQLQKFEDAIAQGQILMLVDIPKERIEEIQTLVRTHYPEADFEGVEPAVKVVPQQQ
ncbi:MAG: DUF1269 domain-containing protein [Candidatus Competibacteraceae bacterium]|nr:DUF1269 domain-containing protein [Candidatus Competibacteraceae bacterium]